MHLSYLPMLLAASFANTSPLPGAFPSSFPLSIPPFSGPEEATDADRKMDSIDSLLLKH